MNLRTIKTVLTLALVTVGAAANAYTFDQAKVEQWIGSGSKSAVVVVDFGEKSFAFGLKWDGDLNGRQALETIDANTSLSSEFGISWGGTNLISYGGYSHYSDTDEYNPDAWWWRYWNSSDGETWESSWVGSGKRMLTDGAWDGWAWSPPFGPAPDYADPWVTPVTPLNTVPEPSSVMALCSMIGLAGSAKLLSLRRK